MTGSCITRTGGSQYLALRDTDRLAEAGVQPSVGSVGDSYDNALANADSARLRPAARSQGASAQTGAPTSMLPSAPSSEPPNDAGSMPIRRSRLRSADNPCSSQVEQLRRANRQGL